MGLNTHQKGYRGLCKATDLMVKNGMDYIRWPHSRFQKDFWGFGDVFGFDAFGTGWFAQVKNTKDKPSKADLEAFKQAVLSRPIDITKHSLFIWFPTRQKPVIWKIIDSELTIVNEKEAFNV